jgi:hypothetical protein
MQIDLRGPHGNAYALLALAASAAQQLEFGAEATSNILTRMCATDYAGMLDVMDDEFLGVFRFLGDPRPNARCLAP